MPYISQTSRSGFEVGPEGHGEGIYLGAQNPGELNYLFTLLAIDYVYRNGKNYQHINDVLGAFEGAKMEFYRRMAAPYEDTKIEQNGDVY